MVRRVGPVLFVLFVAAISALGAPACTSSCEGECSDQYNQCMKTATGASHGDCMASYNACVSRCSQ